MIKLKDAVAKSIEVMESIEASSVEVEFGLDTEMNICPYSLSRIRLKLTRTGVRL